jgi:cytochrome c553
MNKWLVFATILPFVLGASQATAAGDAEAGKAASAACAGCHGADGNSVNPEWPKLAGQGSAYLVKQLHAFKDGERTNATMAPMAMGLGDQDMENLAAYFSGQTMTQGAADESQVDLGQKIYRGGNAASNVAACIGCHGPAGDGNPAAGFPKLSGQHAKYTEIQLNAFKSGERSTDPNKMMRSIAAKMTDSEIQAVASYIQGLH